MALDITRLSGGNTPADGSDPRTFPAIWNATSDALEALDLDDLTGVSITTPAAGEKLVYDGTNWVNLEGYVYVDTVYFTSSGTFTKADYPWLRAIRVKCQGAGGGGAGVLSNPGQQAIGRSGGGGGYAESFITDIASLDASVTVTRGAGGAGGTSAPTDGSAGGTSSFGALVSASGGGAGVFSLSNTLSVLAGVQGGATNTGDLTIDGGPSGSGIVISGSLGLTGFGGDSVLGAGGGGRQTSADGDPGKNYGGGGSAGADRDDTGRPGGAGANGIVIVELYA
jgi:hypothetical protein